MPAAVPADLGGAPADTAYRNGYIYTVDAADSVQQALAVRAGRIVYVGSDGSGSREVSNVSPFRVANAFNR